MGNRVRQKAHDRESAEVIVPGAQTGKDLMSKHCESLQASPEHSETEDTPNKRERKPVEAEGRREGLRMLYKQKEEQQVDLIEWILRDENLKAAIRSVKRNKGAAGIDKMTVEELDAYFQKHGEDIKAQIRAKKYKPQPVSWPGGPSPPARAS